jgi:hypothetical protein
MYLGVSSVTPVSGRRTNLPYIIVILNPETLISDLA